VNLWSRSLFWCRRTVGRRARCWRRALTNANRRRHCRSSSGVRQRVSDAARGQATKRRRRGRMDARLRQVQGWNPATPNCQSRKAKTSARSS
jgi:hypothetical protein